MTYILLLLMDVTNLEPNILFGQGARRIIDNVFKTLQSSSISDSDT